MKERTLTCLSLALSVAAIAYAAWVHHHADKITAAALRRREAEFVTSYAPKMRQVYAGMYGQTNAYPSAPKTIEELFHPMFEMLDVATGAKELPSPPEPKKP